MILIDKCCFKTVFAEWGFFRDKQVGQDEVHLKVFEYLYMTKIY